MLPPCHDEYIEKYLHHLRKEIRTLGPFQLSFCLAHLVWLLSVFLIADFLLEIIEFLRLEKTFKPLEKPDIFWGTFCGRTNILHTCVNHGRDSLKPLWEGFTWPLVLCFLQSGELGAPQPIWLDISCTYYGRIDCPLLQIFQNMLFRPQLYLSLILWPQAGHTNLDLQCFQKQTRKCSVEIWKLLKLHSFFEP